jgi:hypothetical protein
VESFLLGGSLAAARRRDSRGSRVRGIGSRDSRGLRVHGSGSRDSRGWRVHGSGSPLIDGAGR